MLKMEKAGSLYSISVFFFNDSETNDNIYIYINFSRMLIQFSIMRLDIIFIDISSVSLSQRLCCMVINYKSKSDVLCY